MNYCLMKRKISTIKYPITATLKYCSGNVPSEIRAKRSASMIITPNNHYKLPTSITVTGASYSWSNTTGLLILSNATGNVTIKITAEEFMVPSKGNLISMDLGIPTISHGYKDLYRIIKVNDNVAYVMGMYEIGSARYNQDAEKIKIGELTCLKYQDGTLDTAYTTWYNKLSDAAKNAIIPKNLTQDVWVTNGSGSPYYIGKYLYNGSESEYIMSQYSHEGIPYTAEIGERYVYPISFSEIAEYLGVTEDMTYDNTTLNYKNIWKMFCNTTSEPKNFWYSRLISTDGYGSCAWIAYLTSKGIISDEAYWYDYSYRPFFKIDLSKIDFTIKSFFINPTLSNVTASANNPDEVDADGSVTLTFTANSGYYLHPSVTVTNANYSWSRSSDKTTGTLVISNPTGNIQVEIDGTQSILPDIGKLITMNLGNAEPSSGTNNLYRILKVNGTNAEVVAMYDISSSQKFNETSKTVVIGEKTCQQYKDSDLDIALNTTWYNTLSETAKNAIVPKNITQDTWYSSGGAGGGGSPEYVGKYLYRKEYNYYLSIHSNERIPYTVDVGLRNVYSLGIQDIIDYLQVKPWMTSSNTTLSYTNLWDLLWDTKTSPSSSNLWLRSGDSYGSSNSSSISNLGVIDSSIYNYGCSSKPVMTIDLSKIEYSVKSYPITLSLSNVTSDSGNPTYIEYKESSTLTFTSSSGYYVPPAISVSGADYKWTRNSDSTVGTLELGNPVGNINVTIDGVTVAMPNKGSLITMNLGNETPPQWTNNQYRVLKVNGTQAEVLAMYDISTAQKFNETSKTVQIGIKTCQQYKDSDLDVSLNTTWYNTLSDTAKAAIVSKDIKQDAWYYGYSGNPTYSGYFGPSNPGSYSYAVSLYSSDGTAYTADVGSRYIYALSMQDVIDYITDTSVDDGKLQNYNIWRLFTNSGYPPYPAKVSPWLRSAYCGMDTYGWYFYLNYGILEGINGTSGNAARPAFTIDLSKIEWGNYEIIPTLTNVSPDSGNPNQIKTGQSVSLKFTASPGYRLPYSVNVTGATSSWNWSTGILVLSNPKSNVTFSIESVFVGYNVTWSWSGGGAVMGGPAANHCYFSTDDGVNWTDFYSLSQESGSGTTIVSTQLNFNINSQSQETQNYILSTNITDVNAGVGIDR